MKFLRYEITRATTADLLRAANFLEGARDVRQGCREREYPSAIYNEAVAKDEAAWRASVRKRVEGRIKSRKAPEDSE